jgi:hypothetical protein
MFHLHTSELSFLTMPNYVQIKLHCLIKLKIKLNFIMTLYRSWDSSVSIVARLLAGKPVPDYRQELGIFLFITASTMALRPTQPPVQWVSWVFPGVKVAWVWN